MKRTPLGMTGRLTGRSDPIGPRSWMLVLDAGEDPIQELTTFSTERGIGAAAFTAVGGFERATVGFFRIDTQDYDEIPIDEQVEVLSLIGDVSLDKGSPKVHAHVVVGTSDGTTRGGHLLRGSVRPTLEVVLEEHPAELRRRFEPRFGISLIDPAGATSA